MLYATGTTGRFVDLDANIWDVTEYLPVFANGITTSTEVIENIGLNFYKMKSHKKGAAYATPIKISK